MTQTETERERLQYNCHMQKKMPHPAKSLFFWYRVPATANINRTYRHYITMYFKSLFVVYYLKLRQ